MTAAAILDYFFYIFNGGNGQECRTTLLCQILSKSLKPRSRYRNFWIFPNGGCRYLGFSKFQIFNSGDGLEGQTTSMCQISSKSLETRPTYVSFNIVLVSLEIAYSRPFLRGFGAHFPQMMSLIVLTPKRTILGRNHVI